MTHSAKLKVRALSELQASYNKKLLGLYQEQYGMGYWAGYAEAERIMHGPELSIADTPKLTRST